MKEFEVIDYEKGPKPTPKLAAFHSVYFWSLALEVLSAGGCNTPAQRHPSFSMLLTQVTAFIKGDISRRGGISRAARVQTDFTALPLFLGTGVLQNKLRLM